LQASLRDLGLSCQMQESGLKFGKGLIPSYN